MFNAYKKQSTKEGIKMTQVQTQSAGQLGVVFNNGVSSERAPVHAHPTVTAAEFRIQEWVARDPKDKGFAPGKIVR
jgi:hypothetical protein